jgi:ribosomal protein L12E/L44/L45/RPP1/RPP2
MRLIKKGMQKNGLPVTGDHINDVIRNFNMSALPPISLGHPKDSRFPALGRVTKVWKQADGLHGMVQKTPKLIQLESEGYYHGWSAGLQRDPSDNSWYLHHLAWLGELPPASDIDDGSVAYFDSKTSGKEETFLLDMEDSMTPEEVKKLIEESLNKDVKESLTALQAQVAALSEKKTDKNSTGDSKKGTDDKGSDDKKNKTSEPPKKDPETEKQLNALFETLKNERLGSLRGKLNDKGLSDSQIEKILSVATSASALEFSDNGKDSFYNRLIGLCEAIPDSNQNIMTKSMFNLSDNPKEKADDVDVSKLLEFM